MKCKGLVLEEFDANVWKSVCISFVMFPIGEVIKNKI
jgi:hypothetical protein